MRDAVGACQAVKYADLLCLCCWLQSVASALENINNSKNCSSILILSLAFSPHANTTLLRYMRKKMQMREGRCACRAVCLQEENHVYLVKHWAYSFWRDKLVDLNFFHRFETHLMSSTSYHFYNSQTISNFSFPSFLLQNLDLWIHRLYWMLHQGQQASPGSIL